MKNLLSFGLVLLGLLIGSQAHAYSAPADAIFVDEDTVERIKDINCNLEDRENGCTDYADQFSGKVIVRVEKAGKMNLVQTGDGYPVLLPYITDGFYFTGKKGSRKYYYVSGGQKTRLKKGSALRRVKNHVRDWTYSSTPISQYDLDSTSIICEGDPDTGSAAVKECYERYERGEEILTNNRGGLLLNVSDNGQILYIPSSTELNDGDAIELHKKVNGKKFYTFAKEQAEKISGSKIRSLKVL